MLGYVAAAVLLLGVLAGVGYWIKRSLDTRVALDQRDAALLVEREHVAAMEAAAAKERAERARSFDAKATSVVTARDAADLLRDVAGPRRTEPR